MKKIFILSVAATLICSFSFATIRRVGYPGPQVIGTDFADAATAVTASAANDTVQLYPGVINTVTSLNKPIVFIGPGYFLNLNPGLQVATNAAELTISLLPGASGCTFEGIGVRAIDPGLNLSSMPANTTIQNVLFKRCLMYAGRLFYGGVANTGFQNFTFSNCYFPYSFLTDLTGTGQFVKNCVWRNCIFGSATGPILTVTASGTGSIYSNNLFENCSFYASFGTAPLTSSTYFRNCIIRAEPTTANNDVYDYCTFTDNNATHYIAGTGNQYGTSLATLYAGDVTQGLTLGDSPWKLKAGSPAIGWGRDYTNNPTDGGAYGGADPYRLSGIPRVPSFYQLSSSAGAAATANPYPVTFSVRANN